MKKQLIVVVHGVGVREAGISTDLLATALDDDPPLVKDEAGVRDNTAEVAPSITWRPHSSDDFHLRELPRYGTNHKRSIFPARVRRYRHYDKDDPPTILKERVVADFYWGDISATGKEVLALIVGFFKIVLGLSHAVRENARSVFDGDTWQDRFARKLASFAALTIHGPIFAINIVLLVGLAVDWAMRLGAEKLRDPAERVAKASGAIITAMPGQTLVFAGLMTLFSFGFGAWLLRRGDAYLIRFLGGWMVAIGIFFAALAAVDGKSGFTAFYGMDSALRALNCAWLPDSQLAQGRVQGANEVHRRCIHDYQGPALYGMRLQGAMVLAWTVVIGAAIALGVASALRKRAVGAAQPVSFVMPALGLMMLLWFLLFAALWTTVLRLPLNWNTNPNHVSSALRGVGPAVVAVVVLIVTAIALHVRKVRTMGRMSPDDYFKDAPVLAERHRLLIGKVLLWELNAFVLVVALLSADGAMRGLGVGQLLPDAIPAFLQRNATWFMGGLALLAAFIFGYARNAFALGIAIFTDVLVYINDYSWNTSATEDGPNGAYKPVWLEGPARVKTARKADLETPHGYWPSRRIQDRLKVLMAQLIDDEAPDEIVIVSHSQGTVIAIDVIDAEANNWLNASPKGLSLELVTMGSPYTHIYCTYFPKSFRPHRSRDNLNPRYPGPQHSPGVLSKWTNIFRMDDFVGTFIDGSDLPAEGSWPERQWPREYAVPKNGHTMYWTDENVAKILRPLLEAS